MSTAPLPGGTMQPERTGMSPGAKVVFALIIAALVFGLCTIVLAFSLASAIGFGIARSVASSMDDVPAVAGSIADFDLPAGYGDDYAINMLGFSIVGYNSEDDHSHIILAQLPSWVRVDTDDLERQAREAATSQGRNFDQYYRFETVGEEPTTIRVQETTMTIGEGISSDGTAYREIVAPFSGRGGQAVLIVIEPAATWDQTKIDTFIASIR